MAKVKPVFASFYIEEGDVRKCAIGSKKGVVHCHSCFADVSYMETDGRQSFEQAKEEALEKLRGNLQALKAEKKAEAEHVEGLISALTALSESECRDKLEKDSYSFRVGVAPQPKTVE